MSRVIPMLACPRRSDTTLGWIPFSSMNVAWAWRRSWNLTLGNPACRQNRTHEEDKLSGFRGRPPPPSTTRSHNCGWDSSVVDCAYRDRRADPISGHSRGARRDRGDDRGGRGGRGGQGRHRRAADLAVVPTDVVYSRLAGGRPPSAVWGRRSL